LQPVVLYLRPKGSPNPQSFGDDDRSIGLNGADRVPVELPDLACTEPVADLAMGRVYDLNEVVEWYNDRWATDVDDPAAVPWAPLE
jgi:hypothetical protein